MLGVIIAMLWYGYLGEETEESLDDERRINNE
jgi:hypothetical protein|nr:MAG TPA: hypothetical protein [Crassvirales sp.]